MNLSRRYRLTNVCEYCYILMVEHCQQMFLPAMILTKLLNIEKNARFYSAVKTTKETIVFQIGI
jgi:hypothetical protein